LDVAAVDFRPTGFRLDGLALTAQPPHRSYCKR
jgi:hypothetical protein